MDPHTRVCRADGNTEVIMVEIRPQEPMAMCPMASMCRGLADKPLAGPVLMIPGIVFILVGILIILEPRVLVWITAGVTIMVGIFFLMIANLIHRMSGQFRGVQG
jgi:hypothetical protein